MRADRLCASPTRSPSTGLNGSGRQTPTRSTALPSHASAAASSSSPGHGDRSPHRHAARPARRNHPPPGTGPTMRSPRRREEPGGSTAAHKAAQKSSSVEPTDSAAPTANPHGERHSPAPPFKPSSQATGKRPRSPKTLDPCPTVGEKEPEDLDLAPGVRVQIRRPYARLTPRRTSPHFQGRIARTRDRRAGSTGDSRGPVRHRRSDRVLPRTATEGLRAGRRQSLARIQFEKDRREALRWVNGGGR